MTVRFASALAPWITLLVLACTAALWMLQPGRSRLALAAAALLLPIGWVFWMVARRQRTHGADEPGDPSPADSIRVAITLGGLVLLLPQVLALAAELGWLDAPANASLTRRLSGVLAGVILAGYANVIPKQLTPLSSKRCPLGKVQAAQRFSAWLLVLAGGGSALVWAIAPLATADIVTDVLVGGAVVLVMARWITLAATRGRASPDPGT